MACCLMSPSQYLNQWWLIITGILWHSHESNFIKIAHELKIHFEIITTSPRSQQVKSLRLSKLLWFYMFRHQAIAWTMVTEHCLGLMAFTQGQFHRKRSRYLALILVWNLLQCSAVITCINFLTNIYKRHPIACLLRRGMGCLFWIQHLIDILPQFL